MVNPPYSVRENLRWLAYICHLHRWILREKHCGIGTTDSNIFQRPFSHKDDFLKMEPDPNDLCPLLRGLSSQYVDSMWIWWYRCSRKVCSWSLFKSCAAGNDFIFKATRNHRWWLNYPHILKQLPYLSVWLLSSLLLPCAILWYRLSLRDSERPAAEHMNTKELVSLVTITMQQLSELLPFCLSDFLFVFCWSYGERRPNQACP